ncbi:MAG TPA: ATP-binding protein [Chloroflexia bacterium]|nr:ATP-binding protein [Chloroflexia bacterium]
MRSTSGPLPAKLAHPLPPAELWTSSDSPLDLETITDAIEGGRPLSYVLDQVVERACVLLNVHETYVLLREGDLLVGAAQRGLAAENPQDIRLPMDAGIEGWVAVHRRPLAVKNPQQEPRFHQLPQRQHAVESQIVVPLEAQGRVLGVLVVSDGEKTDFSGDLMLLLVLADLATLAIESSRNRGREVRRARLVDLLRYVTTVDYGSDIKKAVEPVADRIAEVLEVEKTDIMFFDPERDALVSLGVSSTPLGNKQRELGLDIVPSSAQSLVYNVYLTGRSEIVEDARYDHRVYRPFVTELGIRSMLITQLTVAGQSRGILAVTDTRPGIFSTDDLAVLDLIGRRVSLALEQIELTEDMSRLEAERLERIERDNFLELLAHDIKNPLAALKGYAQLAGRRLETGDSAYAARALGVINEKADQLTRLMNDMLELTRLAAGTFSIQRGDVDLAVLLRNELDAVETTTTQHSLTYEGPNSLPMRGDRDRLSEVVQNLLSNAIRYSPSGGPVKVSLTTDDVQASIAVCDGGVGIAPEDMPRIFERAYRGQGERVAGGRGLGLYISREIVRLHAGRIWAEPAPDGTGSCFHVVLPLQTAT